MPRYNVVAHFGSTDKYTVEADSEEEAIEKAQRMAYPFDYMGNLVAYEPLPGSMTYVRDVEVECVDWDAEEAEA